MSVFFLDVFLADCYNEKMEILSKIFRKSQLQKTGDTGKEEPSYSNADTVTTDQDNELGKRIYAEHKNDPIIYLVMDDKVGKNQSDEYGNSVHAIGNLGSKISIGWDPENDIVVENDGGTEHIVSRFHCEIIKRGNGYFLKGLRTVNGTFEKDIKIDPNKEYKLSHGHYFEIGASKLVMLGPNMLAPQRLEYILAR